MNREIGKCRHEGNEYNDVLFALRNRWIIAALKSFVSGVSKNCIPNYRDVVYGCRIFLGNSNRRVRGILRSAFAGLSWEFVFPSPNYLERDEYIYMRRFIRSKSRNSSKYFEFAYNSDSCT